MSFLESVFGGSKYGSLTLRAKLDANEKGEHILHLWTEGDDGPVPVENLAELARYGASVRVGGREARLSHADREAMLALMALNPRKAKGKGRYIFKVRPPILQYLRSSDVLSETAASSEYQVQENPLLPKANIDFKPGKGLKINAGYRVPGKSGLVRAGDLPKEDEDGYFRLGKSFYRAQTKVPAPVAELLTEGVRSIPLDRIPEFFKRDLVIIKSNFEAVLTDRAERVQVLDEPVETRVTVDRNEPGWLDFKVEYVVGSHVLPAESISGHQPASIQLDDFTFVSPDLREVSDLRRKFEQLGAEATAVGYRLPVERFQDVKQFLESIGGEKVLAAEYRRFLDQLSDFTAEESFQLPPDVERTLTLRGVKLRPYQRAGIHWLDWLSENYLHGILADDMGLGKTVQTILGMRMTYERTGSKQPSLVIAPRSVLHHWTREFARFAPSLRTYEFHGPNRNRELLHIRTPLVLITTYATASRDVNELAGTPFLFLVLDEATRIKNPDAKRTQAVKALNGAHRISLSGTPIENRPDELWSQFDFLIRGHLGRRGTFDRIYSGPITAGDEAASQRLAERIRPFILRRTKDEVAADLPEKIEMDEWCHLTEEQAAYYGQIQDLHVSGVRSQLLKGVEVRTFSILPILTKLKQVCDHPALIDGKPEPIEKRSEKFDLALAKIHDIHKAGEQVVLFTHFLGMLDLFETSLGEAGIPYVRLDGGTKNRQTLIDAFGKGRATAALCSLQAMSHGVNLQTANHVIHVDRWWNPAVEDQATDRVHRIGQDKNVYVYRLIVQGTLEEKIDKLQERKRSLSDRVVGAATAGEMSWTRDELLEILEPLEKVQ